jgi:hypothetical protein
MSRPKRAVRITSDKPDSPSPKAKRKLTDAQVCEIIWANSQCVKNQTGHCPLLLFGRQIAEALNEFFWSDD